ncbi:MAG: NUDIX hydrolase [Azoarcus sp.]|nr:NUDIX hydrolase [Azoarcus sp.]
MSREWKPNVTVAAVVERDGRFLVVEEETSEGLRINQPAGHLEAGESLVEAVRRETFEETTHRFEPDALVGIYQWRRPQDDVTYLRFTFSGVVGEAVPGARLDTGIVRTLWLTADELRDCTQRHRSPLVLRSLEDWLSGRRASLELIGEGR